MVTIKNLALFGSTLFASGVFGNIMFPQPPIHCSDHCPRGMSCGAEGMCVKPFHPSTVPDNHHTRRRAVKGSTVRRIALEPRQAYSTNGQCGAANGNTICDPASTVYTGSCCSSAGWCGNSPAHCGTGCQSGCTGGGGTTPPPPGPGTPTTDGSCGSTNGGTTCAGWGAGECCSMYGWCGNTAGHCGAGCQNGPCTGGGGGGGGGGGVPPGPAPAPAHPTPGAFTILPQRAGVPAMHAGLLPNGKVVFLDKVEDYTEVRLPNGRYAYSAEYDPSGSVPAVPLAYNTNAFCSGGTFLANGDMLAIGGNGPLTWLDPTVGDGFRGLRLLSRRYNDASLNGQSWRETIGSINSARWYPSAQTLADGRVFVASGSLNGLDPTVLANNNPTWELLSAEGRSITGSTPMPLLVTNQPYYMYPFMHLLRNGQLFVFTDRSSVAINPTNGAVQRTYPDLAGDHRTYPNTGGSVMFPLSAENGWNGKIMICGGGAYQDITSPTDPSCGIIDPLATTPTWEYESMPEGRGMVEGVLLPDGSVLWLNGANKGAQGFLLAEDPTLTALLYTPSRPAGQRFQSLAASTVPRLYHSVALLLLDGTVMVAGSSPNEMPVLTPSPAAPYITDFRVERYTPPYLSGTNASRRPSISYIQVRTWSITAAFTVRINFSVPAGVTVTNDNIKIVLYHGGFVTHSVHMGHRMVYLPFTGYRTGNSQQLTVSMPPNRNVVPPGPYVLYVVVNGIPSVGQFVMIRND